MNNRLLIIMIHAGAFWPVWIWYVERLFDRSDEPWGIVSLFTLIYFIFKNRLREQTNRNTKLFSSISVVLILIYILLYPYLSQLPRALIALLSIVIHASALFCGGRYLFGIIGLSVLSLPIMASLQFYLGYPLRVLTTKIVACLLSAIGYSTLSVGTCLHWAGEVVAIDAPCSGIKLLWCGLYVSFSISIFKHFSFKQTWLLYLLTSILVFFTNALRTFLLFFFESGIWRRDIPGYHSGIGIILSFMLISLLLLIALRIEDKSKFKYA